MCETPQTINPPDLTFLTYFTVNMNTATSGKNHFLIVPFRDYRAVWQHYIFRLVPATGLLKAPYEF